MANDEVNHLERSESAKPVTKHLIGARKSVTAATLAFDASGKIAWLTDACELILNHLEAPQGDKKLSQGETVCCSPPAKALNHQERNNMPNDEINHPAHYTAYEGVEVIQLTEQMNFNRGNAVKYIARAGLKSYDTEIQDLKKALWYIQREINRMEAKLRTEGENEVLDTLRRKLMAPLDERDMLEDQS